MMTRTWMVVFIYLLLLCAAAPVMAAPLSPAMTELCQQFQQLNTEIRDNTVAKKSARERLAALREQIRSEYYAAGGRDTAAGDWVFPLQGYGPRAIGGVNGNEYQARGYDYFDGNRHGGHPSLDIFIHDRRQRSLDDATGAPVNVLSVSGGVVVAAEKEWHPGSRLRGGKYLWIYDPTDDALFYYAHNSDLRVDVGDLVHPGDVIATVGRSGYNAYKRRSPTHLHLTYLSLASGSPAPYSIYRQLLKSRFL